MAARVSPFERGTAERLLHDRYRKSVAAAEVLEKEAAVAITEARAERAKANHYAEALSALGHGDEIQSQKQLPDYTKITNEIGDQ